MVSLKNIEKIFLIISSAVILGSSMLISYWLLYPYNPVDLNALVVESQSGKTLVYTIDYCKHLDLPSTTTRQLIDNAIIFFPSIESHNPVGCSRSKRFIELPNYIQSDIYILKLSTTYQVNPLRKITKTIESNKFQLTK